MAVSVSAQDETSLPSQVSFSRDIQPILSEHCNQCHGVDENTREASLRLDIRDHALEGGDSGEPAIVPGNLDASELMYRITSSDEGEVMPPPDFEKPLSKDQVALLTKWIEEGADYELHWAFVKPLKAHLPASDTSNPIDAFVDANLSAKSLARSPQAEPSILCRRLYLDVVGLPPTLEQLEEFKAIGLEATLEKLLQSERYGEKWARHWLDVARYSDTNGYEKDLRREQWIWRDWVVESLNRDMPYDQFLIEQVAGDLLPNATQSQVIATGFLRNSMINEEGAIIPEQFRMVEMFDRMDCVGKAVLGLTTQCAQCHSHKFDPLTHDEYYGMFAYLNNSFEAKSWVYTEQQQLKISEIQTQLAAIRQRYKDEHEGWQDRLSDWETESMGQRATWEPLVATLLETISGLNHPTQEPDLSLLMLGHSSADMFMLSKPEMLGVTGLRIELLTHGELPFRGPGRSSTGTWDIRELEVFLRGPNGGDWAKQKLVNPTADYSQPDQKQGDEKRILGSVNYLVDGSDDTSWKADRGLGRRNQASVAVLQFETPIDVSEGSELKIVMRMAEMVGSCRFSLTTSPDPRALPIDYRSILAMETPVEQRSDAQHASVFSGWLKTVKEAEAARVEIESLWQQYPSARTSVLHMMERDPEHQRTTSLLDRGEWDRPRQKVEPFTPAIFHSLPESDEPDRLRFARWLADERSPLTARVAVNRVWQSIFGVGLVETSEDFGTRASLPEYRELLDWLAVDFMENGWSQKHLIQTIVMSETYQQSSRATPSLLELDPRNQLLARGPRFRADAEVVRDIALSVSGLITHKLGGPSVIPPVPENVLNYNYTYPGYWKPAEGAERYRRAVYGFRKRSMPDPSMTNFDSPNGDFACARRVRSNTPLAALTGLNEPIFVEAARALALRILREGGDNDEDRISYAYQLCTSRNATDREQEIVLRLLNSQRQRIADGWLDAREVATGEIGRLPELPENATPQDAAAWTIVSRILLNLDETISKN